MVSGSLVLFQRGDLKSVVLLEVVDQSSKFELVPELVPESRPSRWFTTLVADLVQHPAGGGDTPEAVSRDGNAVPVPAAEEPVLGIASPPGARQASACDPPRLAVPTVTNRPAQ